MYLGEWVKLTRFEHAVMLAFAVLIAETIALGALPPPTLIIALSLLIPVFSEMGSFALNDYMDMETDKLNKKNRPLVKGTIKPKTALYFSLLALAISTALAYFVGVLAFIIALAFNAVAILYNWKLKDLPLAGNAYIALTMAIPFIFGNFVVSIALSPVVLILAVLGFVAGLAREIVKSAQDMEGDIKARNSKTLPVVIGRKRALAVALGLYLSFIPLTAVPFAMGLDAAPLQLAFIGAADGLILATCYLVARRPKESYKFARDASLAAFMLGMVGIFLAVL
ncbi:MAG: UbiA family prenyltransferase [Candidatus ainarchaeum sp.]|nr:UbiA family prenyltransferase [Candidatus ainarchaeum sp.]